MALIVEDGTGLSTAESYVAVATVTAYLTKLKDATTLAQWTGATTGEQERACRVASQYMDARYGRRLPGTRINATMALLWPREDAWDLEGYEIEDDEIPVAWQNACCEIALRVVQGDVLFADVDEPNSVASESVTVGPITTSTTYLGGKSATKAYPLVDRILAKILGSSSTIYTG